MSYMANIFKNIILILFIGILSSCGGEESDGTPQDRVESTITGLVQEEISGKCIFIKEVLLFPPQQCFLKTDLEAVVPAVDLTRYKCGNYTKAACCIDDIFRVPDLDIGEVGMVQWLVKQIDDNLVPKIGELYNALVGTTNGAPYANIIYLMMSLAVMLYGASIALGLTHASPYLALMFSMRILFVVVFALNWTNFETIFIRTIEDGIVKGVSNVVISAVANENSGANFDLSVTEQFIAMDQMLSYFFNWKFFQLILATLTSVMGWVYVILLIILMFAYVFLIIEVIQLYLYAMFARAILYMLAPIFIPFILLDQTRSIFVGWFKQLLNFSLQPIFIFAFAALFHLIFMKYLTEGGLLRFEDYKICQGYLFTIQKGLFEFFPWPEITDVTETAISDSSDMPFNLWTIVSLLLLSYMMRNMLQWSSDLAARLSGGVVNLSGITVQGWEGMKENLKVAPAAMIASSKGLLLGQRTAPGMKGTVSRQNGIVGYLQGRGTVGEGFRKSGGAAYRKQKSKAAQAVRKALLGK